MKKLIILITLLTIAVSSGFFLYLGIISDHRHAGKGIAVGAIGLTGSLFALFNTKRLKGELINSLNIWILTLPIIFFLLTISTLGYAWKLKSESTQHYHNAYDLRQQDMDDEASIQSDLYDEKLGQMIAPLLIGLLFMIPWLIFSGLLIKKLAAAITQNKLDQSIQKTIKSMPNKVPHGSR